MTFQTISTETIGQIGVIRLNRPQKLNAINALMIEEIGAALDELVPCVHALVVTSAGRAFCAGAALDEAIPADRAERDLGLVLHTHANPLMSKLRGLSVPWISCVRGAAAGAGASLALAADMIIASPSAYFILSFARVGLVPDAGSTFLLTRTIGRVRAMELTLLAEKLPAQRALEWGLINRIAAEEDLEREALDVAKRLADGPSISLRLTREAVWKAVECQWSESLHTERVSQRIAGRTKDFDEGVAAFIEKRTPRFSGT